MPLPISRRTATVTLAALLLLGGCATDGSVSQTKPIPPLNAENGVALKGHDPVAYFSAGKPMSGQAGIEHRWRGLTWRFASVANRDAFAAEPERYAPQFGGYCAFAISRGYIADIDPAAWAVERGKLYLNNNAFAHQLWEVDRPGNIAAGERNWPLVPKLPVVGG